MGGLRRTGQSALDLGVGDPVGQDRERLRRLIARLHLDPGPIYGAPVKTRRRARLEPREGKPKGFECSRQTHGGRFTDTAGGDLTLPDVDEATQECARGNDNSPGPQGAAVCERDPRNLPVRHGQIVHLGLDHRQVSSFAHRLLHGGGVELAVGLGTRTAHRRAFAAVEDAKLDAPEIRHPTHQAVQGIDLAHEVAFAEAADGRVA